MQSNNKINWLNTLFLIITPLVAIVGTIDLACHDLLVWQTGVLALLSAIASGFSVTAGYHRLFSHLAYRASWPVRLFFLLFGAASFEGSVLEWCTDHRDHHRYTDTDKDPYSIKKGFWYAHIGWLFVLDPNKRHFENVDDLMRDPLVRLQHRFYIPIAVFMGFVLPTMIAWSWGDPLGGLIVAGALRITFSQHTTFCVNSVCHYFGKQTYSDRHTAKDNWLTALLTFGEGYHNFHHQFPIDYRNAIQSYQFDPTKWLIHVLSWLGLVRDLKSVGTHKIIQYRLTMEKKRLQDVMSHAECISMQTKTALQAMYDALTQTVLHIEKLEKALLHLKQEKMHYVQGRMAEYRFLLKTHHQELKKSLNTVKNLMKAWKQFSKPYVMTPA